MKAAKFVGTTQSCYHCKAIPLVNISISPNYYYADARSPYYLYINGSYPNKSDSEEQSSLAARHLISTVNYRFQEKGLYTILLSSNSFNNGSIITVIVDQTQADSYSPLIIAGAVLVIMTVGWIIISVIWNWRAKKHNQYQPLVVTAERVKRVRGLDLFRGILIAFMIFTSQGGIIL